MTFHDDLQGRIANLSDTLTPETDPAIWAVRACGIIGIIIGNEESSSGLKQDVRDALEALYVLAPDQILTATAVVGEMIIKGENA